MVTFSEFLKLANRIKNPELRRKTVSLLRKPEMSRKDLKIKAVDFSEAPASTNFHHVYKGGLLDHTYACTLMSLSIAEILEKVYRIEIDYDALTAGAMIHDIGKLWRLKKEGSAWSDTDLKLDHTMLGVAELYARGFPENVIHIVASHFGEEGPTPPSTIEAIIFHNVDNFDANLGVVDQNAILQQILSQLTENKEQ